MVVVYAKRETRILEVRCVCVLRFRKKSDGRHYALRTHIAF